MTFSPDLGQALVFDHGWSLPVAVASHIDSAHALADKFNEILEWDQFDADWATGRDYETGEFDFPKVGYYYDADKMTLVKDVDEDDLDALVRLLAATGWDN